MRFVILGLFLQLGLFAATEPFLASPVEYFQGFAISAGAGFSGVILDTHRSGIKPKSHTVYGGNGIGVQAKLSGDYAFSDYATLGLEAYGQYNSAKTTNTFYETTSSTAPTKRTFSLPWNLGLDARVGFTPNPDGLLFLFGGVDWGYYDFHYVTTGVNSTFKQFKFGGVFGGGMEQKFSDHLFAKLSLDYRWYGSESLSYSNGEDQKIKAQLATGLLMAGYRF